MTISPTDARDAPQQVIARSRLYDAAGVPIGPTSHVQDALNFLSIANPDERSLIETAFCAPRVLESKLAEATNEAERGTDLAARTAAEANIEALRIAGRRGTTIRYALQLAYAAEQIEPWVEMAGDVARFYDLKVPLSDRSIAFANARSLRETVLNRFGTILQCADTLAAYRTKPAALPWAIVEDGAFADEKPRIYEVGPREQAQQVSTVARSASAIALAANLSASDPGSGSAGEAAANYSRQAMGRAAAIERVPSVVGYSVAGTQTFGWVVAPRAAIEPKGKINMEQMLKPYDLTVDLSFPGWWSELTVELKTAWAPSPGSLSQGNMASAASSTFKIPLGNRGETFLTSTLLERGLKEVRIAEVTGGPVNGCFPSTLLITGDHVWRTEKVMLLGQVIEGEAIRVVPDMSGVLVTVPKITPLAEGNYPKELVLMTPYGNASHQPISYVMEPSGDVCKKDKPDAAEAKDPNAPTISGITPRLEFVVPSDFDIVITGTKLDNVAQVLLHGQKGQLKVSDGGKTLTISFTEKTTSSIDRSDNVSLVFYKKGKTGSPESFDTKQVRISRKGG